MIKLLKLASYLSVALAVSAVVLAGIGITRENSTFRERADFLDKPTVVEILREQKDNIPKSDKDNTSPLVTQAIACALRIDPPPPPPPPGGSEHKTETRTPSVTKRVADKIIRPASSTLMATCRYEKFPEKSLALLKVTSEDPEWLREGDKLGPKTIHRIEDGRIVLRQGSEESILYVPKDNSIKSLLKGSGGDVTATVTPAATGGRSVTRSAARDYRPASTAGRTPGRTTGYSTIRNRVRKRPAQPTSEQARKTAERNNAELKNILDKMSENKKDSSKAKKGEDLMKAVMKMLEAGSKKKAPPKKDSSK